MRLGELCYTVQRMRLVQQGIGQRLSELARDGRSGKVVSELAWLD